MLEVDTQIIKPVKRAVLSGSLSGKMNAFLRSLLEFEFIWNYKIVKNQ
jgi:hypothetical protein